MTRDVSDAALQPVCQGPRRALLARLVLNGLLQAGLACAAGWLVHRFVQALEPVARFSASASAAAIATPTAAAALITLGALVALALSMLGLRALERRTAEAMGQHYVGQLREQLYMRLLTLAPRSVERHTRGGLALRLTGDLRSLRLWVSLGVARSVVCASASGGVLLALAWIEPLLALAVALAAGLVVAAALCFGRRLMPAVREARRHQARLGAYLAERTAQLVQLQAGGQPVRERRRLARLHEHSARAAVRQAGQLTLLRASGDLAATLGIIALLGVGAWLVQQGRVELGMLAAATATASLMLPTLRELGFALAHLQGARVSRERVAAFARTGQVLGLQAGEVLPSRIEPFDPVLSFEGVSLAGSIDGLSVTLPPRGVCVVTGAARAGKSSLLALAARLVDPDAGCVRLAGLPLPQWPLKKLRRTVALVDAQAALWRGTLRYNLCYRAPRATPAEQQQILASCGLLDWVESQPRGLDTRVQEGGANLSQGERFQWALARALLSRPRVLLVDEAGAALGAPAWRTIDALLDSFDGVVVVATHRPERIANAAAEIRLDSGRLAPMSAAMDSTGDDDGTAPRPGHAAGCPQRSERDGDGDGDDGGSNGGSNGGSSGGNTASGAAQSGASAMAPRTRLH